MALKIRALPDELAFALAVANNQMMTDNIASLFHMDRTAAVPTTGVDYKNRSVARLSISSANASSLSTSVTLVNELKTKINVHFADTIAHDTAVSAAITTATATDLATGITLANAIKAAYGTHLSAASVHFTNDSTNTIAAADATDQTSLNTLLNELKADLNLHMASAPKGVWIDVSSA